MNTLSNGSSSSVEHILRQKSTSLENAAARITAVKSNLRLNAEQVRKDISSAISHQLACIRAREQELLSQLEGVVTTKEQLLTEQQEQINQAIGACKQGLECVDLNKSNPSNVQDMLFRLNAIDLRPRDNSRVAFEFDPSDVRRAVSTFGQISTANFVAISESLPLEVEEYEDDATMAHKSIMRLPSGFAENLPRNRTARSDVMSRWNAFTKGSSPDDDFEIIRNRSSSVTSSSVDVLAFEDSNEMTELTPKYLESVLRSPIENWLKPAKLASADESPQSLISGYRPKDSLPANFTSRSCIPELSVLVEQLKVDSSSQPANQRKRPNDEGHTPVAAKKQQFDFGAVICSILDSDTNKWLASSKATGSSAALPTDSEKNSGQPASACDDKFRWLKTYPTKKSDRPVNEISEELAAWEAVIGWKNILEKLHGSGENEWLAPSSRRFANAAKD